jgi:hypothetical protein
MKIVLLLLFLCGCIPWHVREKLPPVFFAGASAVDITPKVEPFDDKNKNGFYDKGEPFSDLNHNGKHDTVWLAGFGFGRQAFQQPHDRLWARALVLKYQNTIFCVVVLDLLGLLNFRVQKIKKRIKKEAGIPENAIIIACTHTHSGPDTIGLWGPLYGFSGLDESYMKELENKVVIAVKMAIQNLREVTILFSYFDAGDFISDWRRPVVKNEVGRAIYIKGADSVIATFVNIACHPESLDDKNHAITSDYPHFLREYVEKKLGGICIFSVADIGGMQSPIKMGKDFDFAKRMGEELGKRVVEGYQKFAKKISEGPIKIANRKFALPVDNLKFRLAHRRKLFGEASIITSDTDWFKQSIVSAGKIGRELLIVTVPGEIFPELAKKIYRKMDTRYKVLIGLGDDEIGYIIPSDDFRPKEYCESMSLGKKTGDIVIGKIYQVLNEIKDAR